MVLLTASARAQMTAVYDNHLKEYNRGMALFEKQKYGAAKAQFELAAARVVNKNSEVSANAQYYIAACANELFHRDAEFLLREFVRNYSTSTRVPDAIFLLGNSNFRKKKYEEAIGYYDQLALADLSEPRKSEVLFKRGYSHFKNEQFEEAANAFYQMADQSSKYYAPSVYYYGHINYQKGQYATALKAFLSLQEHEQFAQVVPYYIVQIHHFEENFDDVVAYGEPFLQDQQVKRRDEISRLVGEAHYRKGNYAAAIPYLEEFVKGKATKALEDYYVLGFSYFKANRFDEAAEQFSKISYGDDLLAQSALFHMGESYLKAGKKSYARNAYRSASQLSHDLQIKEDALFKYAQLAYELSYDPYDGAIEAFKEYIATFPDSERSKDAFDYLVNIYLTSKNYDAALASIDEYENPDIRLKEAYQRIAFNKGAELFIERSYKSAIDYFERSLKHTVNNKTAAEAKYWIAECHYYRGSYSEALKTFEDFIYSPGSALTGYFNLANYNMGYCHFQQDQFIEAPQYFRRYTAVRGEQDLGKLSDANLRIGDCYYMLKQFDQARIYYTEARNIGKSDPDYALYQLAMTEGFLGNLDLKLQELTQLTQQYPGSHHLVAAWYEIGRIHIMKGEDEAALAALNKVVTDFPGSSYVRKALVSIGQTYYNSGRDEEALSVYMRIIKDYPTYNDTREALIGIKNIYVDNGRVAEFEPLIQSLPFVDFSEAALDSLTYEAADRQYANGQCKESVESFTKYLDRFDKPIFRVNARYYRAECLMKMGQHELALKDYHFVADQPQNSFTESALVQVAREAFDALKYPEALAYYKRMALLGQYKYNLLEAEIGQMRCNYALNNHQGAIANAIIALDYEKLDRKMASEANLIIAKSNLALNNSKEALEYLENAIVLDVPSIAAEAVYLKARIHYAADELDSAESVVFALVERYRSEPRWVAMALILLSDVYMAKGDVFQATATLENILENYPEEDEVKENARQKLKSIRDQENAQPPIEEVDFEIYLDAVDTIKTNE